MTRILLLLLLFATALLGPDRSWATSRIGDDVITLEDRARIASVIFAGTVIRTQTVTGGGPPGEVVTHVTFGDVRFAKGPAVRFSAGDVVRPMVITVYGGRYPGRYKGRRGVFESFAEGIPRFQKGSRYIVFADSSLGSAADGFVPTIGGEDGLFLIRPSRGAFVHDYSGHPLISMSRDGFVALDSAVVKRSSAVSDTVRYSQPWEHKGNWGPNTRPLGRIISVERLSDRPDTLRVLRRSRSGRDAIRIVSRALDNGHRVREDEFLGFLKEIAMP